MAARTHLAGIWLDLDDCRIHRLCAPLTPTFVQGATGSAAAKYGGLEVSEAQEVKQLREENGRLKKLVADLSLDKDMLQSVIRKNPMERSLRILTTIR